MSFEGKEGIFPLIFLNILNELFYTNFQHMTEQHFNKIS